MPQDTGDKARLFIGSDMRHGGRRCRPSALYIRRAGGGLLPTLQALSICTLRLVGRSALDVSLAGVALGGRTGNGLDLLALYKRPVSPVPHSIADNPYNI